MVQILSILHFLTEKQLTCRQSRHTSHLGQQKSCKLMQVTAAIYHPLIVSTLWASTNLWVLRTSWTSISLPKRHKIFSHSWYDSSASASAAVVAFFSCNALTNFLFKKSGCAAIVYRNSHKKFQSTTSRKTSPLISLCDSNCYCGK